METDSRPSMEQLIAQTATLFSLPEVVVRLNEVIERPGATVSDIAAVIGQDPALTVRLLRQANSPFYGLSQEVDTISQAVVLLGAQRIRDMALSAAVSDRFGELAMPYEPLEDFWRHSIYTAILARDLAGRCVRGREESLFIGGLVHDIGQMLLFHALPELSHAAFLQSLAGRGDQDPVEVEREVIGFDHAGLGGAVLEGWGLPPLLVDCVRHHHAPSGSQRFPLEVSVVHIANSVAHLAALDSRDPADAPPIDVVAWHRVGLSEAIVEGAILRAQHRVVEVEEMLMLPRRAAAA